MGAGQVSVMLKFLLAKGAPDAVYMLSLRCLCNFFRNQSSNHVAIVQRGAIFDAVAPHLNSPKANVR